MICVNFERNSISTLTNKYFSNSLQIFFFSFPAPASATAALAASPRVGAVPTPGSKSGKSRWWDQAGRTCSRCAAGEECSRSNCGRTRHNSSTPDERIQPPASVGYSCCRSSSTNHSCGGSGPTSSLPSGSERHGSGLPSSQLLLLGLPRPSSASATGCSGASWGKSGSWSGWPRPRPRPICCSLGGGDGVHVLTASSSGKP